MSIAVQHKLDLPRIKALSDDRSIRLKCIFCSFLTVYNKAVYSISNYSGRSAYHFHFTRVNEKKKTRVKVFSLRLNNTFN